MQSSFVTLLLFAFIFGLKMDLFTFFLVLCMATLGYSQSFNVKDYGAVGDGKTDDSDAFTKAWEEVCGATSNTSTLNIPQGIFLLKSLTFEGPCKSAYVDVELQGNIVAPSKKDWNPQEQNWFFFENVNGLIINGTGQIDGQGSEWWKCSPSGSDECKRLTALRFSNCNNLQVSGLKSINSPNSHIVISHCANASFSNLQLSAPADSPNTDGIDIVESNNIQILDSYIGTGDDCIAINSGCYNINITGLNCGPGHGISIGSLGKDGGNASVENIHVKNCTFNKTQNGARIKTWQGGSGYAEDISYENITLIATGNPIFIDQFYCPHTTCSNQAAAVEVSNVTFIGFIGTSIGDYAINLNCSQSIGCTNIFLNHINITSAIRKKVVRSSCNNAHGKWDDSIPKVDCLSE